MDVKYPLLVVATADKKIYVFDLNNPQRPLRELASPLKLQTRVVKAFHSKRFFAVASIEGRCAIRAVDEATDAECVRACPAPRCLVLHVSRPCFFRLDAPDARTGERKPKWAFAFRCHREGTNIHVSLPLQRPHCVGCLRVSRLWLGNVDSDVGSACDSPAVHEA